MKNKYYTPELEEFYFGFEFEANYVKEGWQKEVFGEGLKSISSVPQLLVSFLKNKGLEGNIRVKHLDREDIESLGWNYSNKSNVNNFVFDKLPYRMNVNFATDKNLPKLSIYYYDGENVNQIIIKNKSELKRLMKMLNIQVDEK
jgi:hypothetical protein